MQKIVIEKDEAVADLIERILETEEDSVRLVVPKRSHLLDSESNFRLIAREGKALNKEIIIESVDEKVLEAAKSAGLGSVHPLFDEVAALDGQMSDILPKTKSKARVSKAEEDDERAVSLKVQDYSDEIESEEEEADVVDENSEEESYATLEDYKERPTALRWGLVAGGVMLSLLLVLWGFGVAFGKAEINVKFNRTAWTLKEPVAALTSVKDIDLSKNIIPGQLFQEEKSLVQYFPASGRANVADKAQGTITVVNAYSSDPQTLVATTRFETPDGKIYRLDNQIVVPGAKVQDGKITAQSIKAQVTADKAGPNFNVGRVDKLTIPGFKGSAKFDGFYGVLENGIQGGAVGERAVATEVDIDGAKAKVGETLKSSFEMSFINSIPADIKVLEGASALEAGKININRTAGSDGKFGVTGTALFEAFGFREKDLMTFLTGRASEMKSDSKLIDMDLKYISVTPDFNKKELKFTLDVNANLVPNFDPGKFAENLAGMGEDEARKAILELPDLADAKIKVWPGWLRSLPGNFEKITITVE